MTEAFVFDAVRTPRGKGKKDGSLYEVKPVNLLAGLLTELQRRNGFDTAQVDDVVMGVVSPVGDQGAVLDSGPPITAVLAADEIADAGLDVLARLQQAHYVEGRRIAELAVLKELAAELGLDADDLGSAYDKLQGTATQAHIEQSRALLARIGGHGFPTFALERDGRFTIVDIGPYLGQPDAWRTWLRQQVGGVTAATTGDTSLVCGVDGCAP